MYINDLTKPQEKPQEKLIKQRILVYGFIQLCKGYVFIVFFHLSLRATKSFKRPLNIATCASSNDSFDTYENNTSFVCKRCRIGVMAVQVHYSWHTA